MASSRAPRSAFVLTVAARMMARDEEDRRSWTRPLAVGLGILAVATLVLHVFVIAAVWSACLTVAATIGCVVTSSLRRLVPTLAVTVVGVAVGVASLQTVLAVATGFEIELTERISAFNGHVLLTKYGLDFFEYETLAEELRRDPRIVSDSPFAFGTVAVAGTDEDGAGPRVVMVKGVLPERVAAFPGFAETFRGGDPAVLSPAQPRTRPGAAVGYRLARELGVEVGDGIVLVSPRALDGTQSTFDAPPRRAEYEVRDIVETGVLELDERAILTHLTAAQALLFGEGRVTGIELRLRDANMAGPVAGEVTRSLNADFPMPLYRTVTWREQGAGLLSILTQARLILSLVLGLIIVVAGSTLVMSLLLLVRRRRHDIAILSAMGTSRPTVFWIFEAVGFGAGLLGAALGLLTGTVACVCLWSMRFELADGIYPVEYLPVAARASDALLPAAVSLLACTLVSGPIALAAARVRTLDALRH